MSRSGCGTAGPGAWPRRRDPGSRRRRSRAGRIPGRDAAERPSLGTARLGTAWPGPARWSGRDGRPHPAPPAARVGRRRRPGGAGTWRLRGRGLPGELGAGRRHGGAVDAPQRHLELHQPRGGGGGGGGGRCWRGAGGAAAADRGGSGCRGRSRVGPRGGARRRQPPDAAAAGAVAEVPGQPGPAAPALRGDQRQRGQRPLLQVRALHHLPDPLRPVRQGPRRHRPALLGLRAAEPAPALPLRLRHGRRRLPQEEAAPQLHRRDHRQAEPGLRAVPVPPALHRRDPPLPRVPRVLLPAGPAGRAAPDLHRHVPRGAGHLGQRLPAAGPPGGLRLRPLPPDAGRAGRLPPGAGRARRGPRLLRAGAAAAGSAGQPPAAGALPAGPRPPGLEGGQGQAAFGGPAAGPAGGRAAAAAAAHPEGVSHQGASGVSGPPPAGLGGAGGSC